MKFRDDMPARLIGILIVLAAVVTIALAMLS